ncbi:MAG: hypothetical protein SOV27_03085 [Eubacteriales bacterium]|nr:hypothetical protein [Eubacteriales bacterium]
MKNFIMKIILHFMYRGIRVLNGRDSVITRELKALPNGYTIRIDTDINNAKSICIQILDGKVKKIKKPDKVDLAIIFKNKQLAYKIFMGKISIAQGYAEHYFQMFGNIYLAMGVTRILERVEGYLFPKCINKNCLKRPFKREISLFRTYILCIF